MPAVPDRGKLPVISDATSLIKALYAVEDMVVPVTAAVPLGKL
jgi:hypothetical protein